MGRTAMMYGSGFFPIGRLGEGGEEVQGLVLKYSFIEDADGLFQHACIAFHKLIKSLKHLVLASG